MRNCAFELLTAVYVRECVLGLLTTVWSLSKNWLKKQQGVRKDRDGEGCGENRLVRDINTQHTRMQI